MKNKKAQTSRSAELPKDYKQTLNDIKTVIKEAQNKGLFANKGKMGFGFKKEKKKC